MWCVHSDVSIDACSSTKQESMSTSSAFLQLLLQFNSVFCTWKFLSYDFAMKYFTKPFPRHSRYFLPLEPKPKPKSKQVYFEFIWCKWLGSISSFSSSLTYFVYKLWIYKLWTLWYSIYISMVTPNCMHDAHPYGGCGFY